MRDSGTSRFTHRRSSPTFPGAWPSDSPVQRSNNPSLSSLATMSLGLEPVSQPYDVNFSEDIISSLLRISGEQDTPTPTKEEPLKKDAYIPGIGTPLATEKTLINPSSCYHPELAMETIEEEDASETRIYEENIQTDIAKIDSETKNFIPGSTAFKLLPEIPSESFYSDFKREQNEYKATHASVDIHGLTTELQQAIDSSEFAGVEPLDLSLTLDSPGPSHSKVQQPTPDSSIFASKFDPDVAPLPTMKNTVVLAPDFVIQKPSFDSDFDMLTLDAPSFTLSLPGSPENTKILKTQGQGVAPGDGPSTRSSLQLSGCGGEDTKDPEISASCISTQLRSLRMFGRDIKGLMRRKQKGSLERPESRHGDTSISVRPEESQTPRNIHALNTPRKAKVGRTISALLEIDRGQEVREWRVRSSRDWGLLYAFDGRTTDSGYPHDYSRDLTSL